MAAAENRWTRRCPRLARMEARRAPEPSSQAPRAARFVLTVDRGDPSTVDHRERLWDRRSEIAADPFQILYQKKIISFVATALIWNFANPPSPRVRSAVNHHHPHYRPSTMANVSGSAVRDRDPTIRDYFQKMLSSAPPAKAGQQVALVERSWIFGAAMLKTWHPKIEWAALQCVGFCACAMCRGAR